MTSRALRNAALRWIFPGILLNVVIGNQLWSIGPLLVGQVLLWALIAASAVILVTTFTRGYWPYVLIAAVPAMRVASAGTGAPAAELLYLVALNALFLAAGFVAAAERPTMIYRQVRGYLLLSVPLMFLQVAGAGEWTQSLNTEYWAEEEWGSPRPVHPTLLVPEESLVYGVGQGRPAGLMHSNNVLSIVICFGFALHLARIRSSKATWTDAALLATMVMAMAKIVIVIFLLMVLWYLVTGDGGVRTRVWRMLALTLGLYGLYALLFPGLFAVQTSLYKITYSFIVRTVDLMSALDEGQRAALIGMFADAPQYKYASDTDVGALSGYAVIVKYAPVILPLAAVMGVLLLAGFRRLRRDQATTTSRAAVLVLIVVTLFPAAVPFWRAQLYWFIFGFTAVPIVMLLSPGTVHRRWQSAFRVRARPGLAGGVW